MFFLIRHQLRDRVIQIKDQLQTKPKQNQKRRVNRTQLQYGEQDEKSQDCGETKATHY